jgi:hypothetical protein
MMPQSELYFISLWSKISNYIMNNLANKVKGKCLIMYCIICDLFVRKIYSIPLMYQSIWFLYLTKFENKIIALKKTLSISCDILKGNVPTAIIIIIYLCASKTSQEVGFIDRLLGCLKTFHNTFRSSIFYAFLPKYLWCDLYVWQAAEADKNVTCTRQLVTIKVTLTYCTYVWCEM